MSARHRRRAFSIIELMVSIGVIGLLLGILLPALAGARERAREAKSLANLHNLGLTIATYTQQHKGQFPFPPKDNGEYGPFLWPLSGDPNVDTENVVRIISSSVWGASEWWPTLLHDVAPWREHFETWLSPGMDRGSRDEPPWAAIVPRTMGYAYSTSFLAKPIVWSSSPASEADIGPVSADMVAQPSAKAIFFDAARAYLRAITPTSPRPVLFVDGAASLRRDADATLPVRNQITRSNPRRYHDTPMGVQGRDF